MTDYQLVLLHAKWCGHCKRFNPKKREDGDKLTWLDVKNKVKDKIKCTEFEEQELNEDKEGWDMESLRNTAQGWPTLLFVVKKDNKYKPHSYFEGNRGDINDFIEAIDGVINETTKPILSGGGIKMVNMYRLKYKKYKQLYADLIKKYNKLKN